MTHGRRWRLSFLWRLIIGLTILLAFAAGSITYAARQADQYSCLRFNGTTLLDVNSGVHVIDLRPSDIGYPAASVYNSILSPDKQHVVYLGPGLRSETLYIQVGAGPAVPLADHIDYVGSIGWSPASSELAYTLMSDHKLRLAVVRADGSAPTVVNDTGNPSLYSWSPQGKYLAYMEGTTAQRYLALWSVDKQRPAALIQPISSVGALVFDASEQHVAFVWSDASLNHWISIGSPDQPTAKQFKLPAASYDFHLVWSPDGKYIAMQYRAHWPLWTFAIYGTDGSAMPDIAESLQPSEAPADPLAVWSADSRSLTYVVQYPNQHRDLMTYNIADGTSSALAVNLRVPPVYSPRKDRLALYRDDGLGVDVMDVDGANRVAFIRDAASIGPIQWSADGSQLAVAWLSSAPDTPPGLTLSWMKSDGSQRHDLHDDLNDMPNLLWINGAQHLAFVGAHDGHFDVTLVDANTGLESRLLDGLTQVTALRFDPAQELLTFWWRTASAAGADGYALDGSRAYRLPVLGDIDDHAQIFWSPDKAIAAFRPSPQSLEIAVPGAAAPIVVRSGVNGMSDPAWSPDGSQLAFTQPTSTTSNALLSVNTLFTLYVVSANGTEKHHFAGFVDLDPYRSLSWSQCR